MFFKKQHSMDYNEFITSDYTIMLGKPVIKGTRITVELVLRKIAEGASYNDLLDMYPHLSLDAIRAVMAYAADVIANEDNLIVAA